MKKLVCLFLIFIAYFANSQDFEPTQAKFIWGIGGNETYLSADSAYFKQDKFLRGWHWGASYKISHAVGANQNDAANSDVEASSLDSNCLIILKPEDYTHGNEGQILNARAIQYEPTLLLNPNNPSNLVKRQGDTTRPVFGFLNRRGRVLTDSTDPNFNRLIIDSAELVNQVILSEPWPSNQISLATIGQTDETILNDFLCKTLYFSINLRRTGSEMNNDTVLKIELPYTYLYDSAYIIPPDSITIHHKTLVGYGSIQFANLPSPAQYPIGTYELANGRGCIRDTISLDSGARAIYITKQMLPPNNKDITISAFFKLNRNTKRHNPELKDESPSIDKIDSIKIKITYLGGGPLMIDWVRIETPHEYFSHL